MSNRKALIPCHRVIAADGSLASYFPSPSRSPSIVWP
ncbi:MAG: MGMT family protein [Sphingomonadales bacterium]|nr:MAG: MGMT family protein [Sphingomonadales bacterium]